jgi:hypothetical protein
MLVYLYMKEKCLSCLNHLCGGSLRYSQAAGHRWLTPEILATQETEIRKIMVLSQFEQRSYLENTNLKKGLAE